MKFKEGWLKRQLEQASKTVKRWSKIKQEVMRLNK